MLTPSPVVCVASLLDGGWGRTGLRGFCVVGAPRDAVAPCCPSVRLPPIHPFWVEGHGGGRCLHPMGPLTKFVLKSGDLLCSGGGGGFCCGSGGSGGGGCSGGGGGHFTKFVLESGDGGGSGIGCDLQNMHEKSLPPTGARRRMELEYQDWARLQGRGPRID
jgi:hypothetical protein